MPKVYSYIRFSSKAQATGDSLRRQTANTLKWAARCGYELDEALTYRDLGVSAYDRTNLRSGALGLFLRAAQEGKIERGSILAIEALDRLTRAEPLDAFRLLSDIVACGVAIVTVSDERVYDEASLNGDFASLMLAAALLVRGHEESKRKSERLKAGFSARRESGSNRIASMAPNWLRFEGNAWVAIPDQAQIVQELFELAAGGLGANAIAVRMNQQQRPLVNRGRVSATGWHAANVAKLLRSRTVVGEYHPHVLNKEGKRVPAGEPIAKYYPAIVPEPLFWKVQSLMNERSRGGRGYRRDLAYGNVLQGFAYCGYCGAPMYLDRHGHGLKTPTMKFYMYACSAALRHATACINKINYQALLLGAEERTKGKYPRPRRTSFLSALFENLMMIGEQLTDAADRRVEQAHQDHDAALAQLADAEVRKGKLIEALESGVLTLAEIQPRLDRIRGEMAQYQAKIDQALEAMKAPDADDDGWLLTVVENHMFELAPILTQVDKVDERAALRTRLMQRVEAIYLYRECARVKLRHHPQVLFIALQAFEGKPLLDLNDLDALYPLPARAMPEPQ
jgi:DNA invertase Pin-like site-specific DNA recombinase